MSGSFHSPTRHGEFAAPVRRIPDLLVRCIAAIMKIPFAPGMAIPLLGAAGLIGAAGYSWTLPDPIRFDYRRRDWGQLHCWGRC